MNERPSRVFQGLSVAEGFAVGRAFLYTTDVSCVLKKETAEAEIDAEISRYHEAHEAVERYYESAIGEAARDLGTEEADILRSHLLILRDPYFLEEVPARIRSDRTNSEWLVAEGVHRIAKTLGESTNPYLRERAVDVEDVGRQLLHRLLQLEGIGHIPSHESVIVVARELTASDILRLRESRVLALVTDLGTATSHAAVIARLLGIPVVMGTTGLSSVAANGDVICVDGFAGTVQLNPDPGSIRQFSERIREAESQRVRIMEDISLPAETTDGVRISLAANISQPEETAHALDAGAEGVGLFRTEFAFLAEGRLLSEEEQSGIYRRVVEGMAGRPVVIRTLDLGGDKLVPHHERQLEANPFLGWRSIRISLHMREGFKIQLRSILRASAKGPVKIMFPMISTVDEVIQVNKVLDEVMHEMTGLGIEHDTRMPRGIMIEVPSAAVNIRAFLPHTDFVSVGTNDLIQYTLAVDRSNPRVASYYRPCDPSVLRLIRHTAWSARRARKRISVCGEMAGRPAYVPLLIGLGADELSMAPNLIPQAKHVIRHTSFADATRLARDALACATAADVDALVDEYMKMKSVA